MSSNWCVKATLITTLIILINRSHCVSGKSNPCDKHTSLNISHGLKFDNGTVLADGVFYAPHQMYMEEGVDAHVRGCICLIKTCSRRCCSEGSFYDEEESRCIEDESGFLNFDPPVHDSSLRKMNKTDLAFLVDFPCEQFFLTDHNLPGDEVYLLEDGSIQIGKENLDVQKYCLDLVENENGTFLRAMWCYDVESNEDVSASRITMLVNAIGMAISLPLLLITFLVYAIIPELRNLHGKALMGYVSALMVSYSALLVTQIYASTFHDINTELCTSLAFLVYIGFMVTFFWLNVMSFDIWWTFRGMQSARSRRASERRRFILYGLYAWGIPILLTLFFAFMEFSSVVPNTFIKPEIAQKRCWIEGTKSTLLYFYLPLMILTVINIVLFGVTAYKILAIKRETRVLKSNESKRHSQIDKDKQRFALYIKLFTVMGISWIAEFTSFLIGGNSYFWLVTDLVNTLQGVFVFVIFVCKAKVKNLLIKRYRRIRYGSTSLKTRDSSRYRSHNISTSGTEHTEKSFLSMDDKTIKMVNFK